MGCTLLLGPISRVSYRFYLQSSAGGGITKINFSPGTNIPNMQIGNRNVMVIGAGGDAENKVKSKSKKSKEKVKLTGKKRALDRF